MAGYPSSSRRRLVVCLFTHRHHDGAADGDVRHGVDEVREEVGEDVGLRLEGAEGVVDAAAHDERHVEARQGEQQLVEDVAQLRPAYVCAIRS